MKTKLQIRDIVKETGLDRETLRFYEQKGLLGKPERNSAGYRLFEAKVISRLKFIRFAQNVGFSLKEILELLNLGQKKALSKADLKKIAERKISEIDSRIKSLEAMRDMLAGLSQMSTRLTKSAECPILSQFENLEL
jgi:MerR family transcriptional regulator, copper efflux regulator